MKKQIEQKYAVVTGGTSGIGKAMADELLAQGYKVAIIAREQCENVISCDVSSNEQVKKAFSQIAESFPRIDVLVNSAGIGCIGALELVNPELVERTYKVNVFGTIYCIQQALPLMSAGSKIFNISSIQAVVPMPYKSMYCSTKAAVLSLSYALRMELKNAGIQVCCFCPGDIKTNFSKNRIGEVATNERYGNTIKNGIAWRDNRDDKSAPVSVVIKSFKKELKRKHVKAIDIMPYKYKFVYFASRHFPTSWYHSAIKKIFIRK